MVQTTGTDTIAVRKKLQTLNDIWLEYLPANLIEARKTPKGAAEDKFGDVWAKYWAWSTVITNSTHAALTQDTPSQVAPTSSAGRTKMKLKNSLRQKAAECLPSDSSPTTAQTHHDTHTYELIQALDALQYDFSSHVQSTWMERFHALPSSPSVEEEQQHEQASISQASSISPSKELSPTQFDNDL